MALAHFYNMITISYGYYPQAGTCLVVQHNLDMLCPIQSTLGLPKQTVLTSVSRARSRALEPPLLSYDSSLQRFRGPDIEMALLQLYNTTCMTSTKDPETTGQISMGVDLSRARSTALKRNSTLLLLFERSAVLARVSNIRLALAYLYTIHFDQERSQHSIGIAQSYTLLFNQTGSLISTCPFIQRPSREVFHPIHPITFRAQGVEIFFVEQLVQRIK